MSDAPTFATLTPALWQSLWLTVRLAAISTAILLLIALPLAGWLDRTRLRAAPWIEALVSMPIVLPPTVIGFYLLVVFGGGSPLGDGWRALFGSPLAFSFAGLVVGSVIYSLPFAVQPIQNAIRDVEAALIEAAGGRAATFSASLARMSWKRIVKFDMRRFSRGLMATLPATISTSSGRENQGVPPERLRSRSETRSFDWATPCSVTISSADCIK